jgi:hypothetical protein
MPTIILCVDHHFNHRIVCWPLCQLLLDLSDQNGIGKDVLADYDDCIQISLDLEEQTKCWTEPEI